MRLSVEASGTGDGAVSGMDLSPQSDRKPLVTFRKTTEGLISRSEMLLVGGTSRSARKTKNLVRHALIWRSS